MSGTEIGPARTRGAGELKVLSFLHDQAKTFTDVLVHPNQEMLRHPAGAFFRGGPEWPRFEMQVYARHCWRLMPTPVDSRPHPSDQLVESADSLDHLPLTRDHACPICGGKLARLREDITESLEVLLWFLTTG